ncbi:hypothetical protein I9018_32360 [Pseudomonas sp. MPFS]|uniref:hypothetical protein n=1 Tax=Pseudomonas sp. MPFS TaxID=2795724 RepID=UPI001F12F929|nr:hypothetical protein [Pseudomonas sp. MPFS]UMZ12099.1 hypothetical protein I9018_32360 [Pseudomonas sp. MPFS]
MNRIEWIKDCLLVRVVADALNAPVEILEWSAIRATFSAQGNVNYAPAYEVIERVADDIERVPLDYSSMEENLISPSKCNIQGAEHADKTSSVHL